MVTLYHILFYSQLYLRCPKSWRVFFFVIVQVCRDRILLSRQNTCRSRASIVRASQLHAHACRAYPALSWETEHLCRARQSASNACAMPYRDKLAARAISVSYRDTNELRRDMGSLTITELCRNLKFSCRDLVSITYTSLCRDKEKSCRIESSFLACRDRIPRPARTYVVRAQGLSCAPSLICCVCMASSATTQRGIAL